MILNESEPRLKKGNIPAPVALFCFPAFFPVIRYYDVIPRGKSEASSENGESIAVTLGINKIEQKNDAGEDFRNRRHS
ncbi:hypothetical protein CDAR_4381 [Caerostris darwini]|uniref:Uncharacterized protein n=1 Tax=Caerostris darwini TaxID=1538125 RepID=A0AAV4V8H9_9ARAC|nr:hypothetical protein CDAR_4381 [Caerostris darwini]